MKNLSGYLCILLFIWLVTFHNIKVLCNEYIINYDYDNNLNTINLKCSTINGTSNDATAFKNKRSIGSPPVSQKKGYSYHTNVNLIKHDINGYNGMNDDKVDTYSNKENVKIAREDSTTVNTTFSSTESITGDSTDNSSYVSKSVLTITCAIFKLNSSVVNVDYAHVKIKSTGILEIPSKWGQNNENITSLIISTKGELKLPSDCDWFPHTLRSLDLAYSPISNLTFNNCSASLRKLILQGTSMKNLSLCLNSLEELDVSWNFLSGEGVKRTCQEATARVRNLKMHNNQLTHWSSCGWPSVMNLELQKNEISSVNFSSCPLHKLSHINLSTNKLQASPIKYPPKLFSINLSYNRIAHTSHFNRAIQDIDLSHNSLTSIGRGTFRLASRLLSLDLSHNHLIVIYGHDFGDLRSLRYLDISHNSLTHIRHEAFRSLRFILNLKIHDNNLHQLDSRLMVNLPTNVHFEVHNNPWRCSCHLLASIKKASTSHCRSDCQHMQDLTCQERKVEVSAQNVLQQCVEAMQDLKADSPVHFLPSQRESDEDISEEDLEETSGSESSYQRYLAISGTVFLVLIPFIGFGIRMAYIRRKVIKRWCNCRKHSQDYTSELSNSALARDSDSETEF